MAYCSIVLFAIFYIRSALQVYVHIHNARLMVIKIRERSVYDSAANAYVLIYNQTKQRVQNKQIKKTKTSTSNCAHKQNL